MSWFEKNIIENPLLNPAGWLAGEIRKDNGGTASERVAKYGQSVQLLPGCDGNPTNEHCIFKGTDADWQDFRTNWINDCMSKNTGGILESKNKTTAACQALFDDKAKNIQLDIYESNKKELDKVKDLLGKFNPLVYVGVFLFVALIIYLLMSK